MKHFKKLVYFLCHKHRLNAAYERDDVAQMEKILKSLKAAGYPMAQIVSTRDKYELAPLMKIKSIEAAQLLIEYGAPLNPHYNVVENRQLVEKSLLYFHEKNEALCLFLIGQGTTVRKDRITHDRHYDKAEPVLEDFMVEHKANIFKALLQNLYPGVYVNYTDDVLAASMFAERPKIFEIVLDNYLDSYQKEKESKQDNPYYDKKELSEKITEERHKLFERITHIVLFHASSPANIDFLKILASKTETVQELKDIQGYLLGSQVAKERKFVELTKESFEAQQIKLEKNWLQTVVVPTLKNETVASRKQPHKI